MKFNFNDSEDFYIDLSASCTKEQAVLRLLDWRESTIKKYFFHIDHTGAKKTDIKEISPTAIDLHDYLSEIYKEALQKYENAIPDKYTKDELNAIIYEHTPNINKAKETIEQAHSYLMDITDELAKPNCSLRIDQETTIKEGKTYITIRSLNEWKKKKYQDTNGSPNAEPSSPDNEISEGDSQFVPANIKTSYLNLLTSFSIAINIISETSKSFKYKERINVSQISEKMSSTGQSMTRTGNFALPGQTPTAIRDRINKALKYLDTKIP